MSPGPVLFRADASHAKGFGHVARICAVIEELHDRGAATIAMFGGDAPALAAWTAQHGLDALIGDWTFTQLVEVAKTENVSSIVLDGPHLVTELVDQLAERGLRTVVVDDQGQMTAPVAAVINHNIHAESLAATYPNAKTKLLGRTYMMLRREIRRYARGSCQPVTRSRPRVIVTFGGSDPPDATSRTLRLLPADRALELVVIAGPGYLHDDALRGALQVATDQGHTVELRRSPGDPGALFVGADAAICSGGGTLGELAYLGCPALAYAIVPDQLAPVRHQLQAGLIAGGRTWAEAPDDTLRSDFEAFLLDDAGRAAQRQRALATADADGAKRIIQEALQL